MKRLIAIVALACAAAAGTGARAATLEQSYSMGFSYSAGSVWASGMLNTVWDRLTGTVTSAWANICTNNGSVSCQSGAFVIDADPLGQTGTITGTVGPMTVNLDWLATHVNTSVPYFDVELNPYTASATMYGNFGRSGRLAGTITSTNGAVSLSNAWGSMGVNFNAAAP